MASKQQDPGPDRYSRQVLFPPVGSGGQRRIAASSVTIVGCGALGASAAEQLARVGAGRIRLIDRDIVEWSNLGRQGLYDATDALERRPKALALRGHLQRFNDEIQVESAVAELRPSRAGRLLGGSDLVIDGTDNFETRYLINDWCVREGIPWIYGACIAARGLTSVILPGETPCLRCLFPEPPPGGAAETCDTAGIIAPAAVLIASLQVAEAIKVLVGDRSAVRRSLLSVELWPFRIFELGGPGATPGPECPCCGARQFPFLDASDEGRAIVHCGRDAVHIVPGAGARPFDLQAVVSRLGSRFPVKLGEGVAHWILPEATLTLFEDGRALVSGINDGDLARSLYDRYVGG